MANVESDLVPYTALSCLPGHRVLVIAPHPDDEVFGCGGAIAAHVRAGHTVRVVVLTDGAAFGLASQRELESIAAARVLGYGEPEFWRLADRKLHYCEDLLQRLLALCQAWAVDLVYAPSPWEVHPDHRQAMMLAQEAVLRLDKSVRLAFYEVGAALRPNVLLDLSPVLTCKLAAMQCFASQIARQAYIQQIGGLNQFRTYTLGTGVQAAEAFWLLEATQLRHEAARHWPCAAGIAAPHQASDDGSAPLVSVLIRSMDRRFLSDALDSIALQTYGSIEVLVIAATPDHGPAPARCGAFSVSLLRSASPLGRSAAANVGLDCAKGEFLLFLDDDDWLMPGHIERLVSVLQYQPNAYAAYTGISVVDGEGQSSGQVFDLPFDANRLAATNLMPIHAVLFRRAVLERGCRFDEGLDMFEDWDFWLQISSLAPMVHLPGVSGVYRIHNSSGVNAQADASSEAAQKIVAKWRSQWSQGQIMGLIERARRYHDVEPLLAEGRAATQDLSQAREALSQAQTDLTQHAQRQSDLQNEIVDLRRQLAARTDDLTALLHSRSWRLTAPVRALSSRLRRIPLISTGLRLLWRGMRSLYYRGPRGQQPGLLNASDTGLARARRSYASWIDAFDTPVPHDLQAMRDWSDALTQPPLISVLMPVYNPSLKVLEQAIESVLQQVYPHWELCIADDASPNPAIGELLRAYAALDARIKLVLRESNGHIVAASNSALALTTGAFVALMDHDDLLPPHALYWVANTVVKSPDVAVIYSDEDKIDAQGRRYDPYFKSDWNLELFLSQNLISHLGVYRRSLLLELGGFREGFEGSQDYDLALRFVGCCRPDQIVHIPRILYHWRASPGSTALAAGEKPYAAAAGARALQCFLDANGIGGTVEVQDSGFYRVRHAPLRHKPLVSILIPTKNGLALVRQCIDSVLTRTLYKNIEIILIDNNSDEPAALAYFKTLESNRSIKLIRDHGEFNFSRINNSAAKQARGDFICLMNNDIEVLSNDWLDEMIALAMRPGVGAVGARLWYPDGRLQHGGVIIGSLGVAGHAHLGLRKGENGYFGRAALTQSFSAVTAACLLVAKSTYWKVGGFNEQNLAVAFNDVDFCLKLVAAGYRNVWTPFAELKHHESATRGYEDTPEKRARFTRETDYMRSTWSEILPYDPAYNVNLSLAGDLFELAWPPRTTA